MRGSRWPQPRRRRPWPPEASSWFGVPPWAGAGAGLEDGRLGVAAEDLLQRVHDLALARMNTSAVEEMRHEVGFGCCLLLEDAEGGLDLPGVASGADGLDAADLLGFEGRVDAQDRVLVVVALGVLVDADDDPPAGVDLALELIACVGDLALGEVLLD